MTGIPHVKLIDSNRPRSPGYQVFVLSLCFVALLLLLVQGVIRIDPQSRTILDYVDNTICFLFLVDFVICLFRAPEPLKYFYTWGWLDLLSCIPSIEIMRWGRVARIFRVFRVLRAIKSGRLLAQLVLQRRSESTVLAASLVAMLLVFVSSVFILQFETDPQSNISTAEDAVWWAFTTITTVGYGDRYPVTPEGRIIAVVLMSAGVGLFGAFSAFLASWFLQSDISREDQEIAALRQEISALRGLLEAQTAVLAKMANGL